MRRRSIAICLALSALAPLAAAPAAPAKGKKAKKPSVTRVSPMRVRLGATITIRGRNFSSKRKRNTVVFRGPGGRSAFAKPRRASRRKLVVKLPLAISRIVGSSATGPKATRFKLRVIVRRTYGRWTSRRLSPVIVSGRASGRPGDPGSPGDPGGPGAGAGCTAGDYDGDLLSGSLEDSIGTDACLADSDGDGVEDGFEEQSAIDLNHYPATPPLPYSGRRPYPNALDPTDAGTDYDGDGVALREEFLLWVRFSADGTARSGRPTTLSSLLYSDGLQRSRSVAAPGGALLNWALDPNEDGVLHDGERDGDGDGLSNWDEQRGKFTEAWWPARHDGEHEPLESEYPDIDFLDNEDLAKRDALADRDIDGDGVADGADDSDHDGLSNQFEVRRPSNWLAKAFPAYPAWTFAAYPDYFAYTNPFNPCKPVDSERCHQYVPFGYYDEDEVPPIGAPPPGGYPATHPTTPNG